MITRPGLPRTITSIIGAVAVLLLLTKIFFIGYYRVPQNGMYPGLPAGTSFFTSKKAYSNASQVKRGDIIVFTHEENGQIFQYIWRVVGLPGEKIETARDSLSINGQPVQRKRLREENDKTIFNEQIDDISYEVAFDQAPITVLPDVSVTVPPDHFFVMGDNRLDARDSRDFGTIPFSSIIGKKL